MSLTLPPASSPAARGMLKASTANIAYYRSKTNQPVHRRSFHAGDREVRRWREHNTFPTTEHNARMKAVEDFEQHTRLAGRRNGALGHIALEVYRLFLRRRGRKGGRLDMAHATIARELRRSVSAIRDALGRLQAAGFIDWVRRTQRVDDPARPDQYVEQISNAYMFSLPASAARLVARMLRRPTEAVRAMAAQLARERKLASGDIAGVIAEVDDPRLKDTLARMSALFDQCESS